MKALSLGLFFAASTLLPAEEVPLETFIEAKRKQYHVPGAVVVVVQEGKQPWIEGFGVTDLQSQRKVDADTRFQIASVSKTFTGALFGIALDRKEIGLNQPVKEVFPAFQLKDEYATRWANVPDLLAHRSGLPAYEGGLLELLGFSAKEIISKTRQIEPEASFRRQADYNNIGYFLAGEATAQAAKQDWATLLKTRLLDPLKMQDSGLASEVMTHRENAAQPYVRHADGTLAPTLPNYQPTLRPAGAIASTGRDMARYIGMWLQLKPAGSSPVLSAKSIETLWTPIIPEEPSFAELPPISALSGFNFTAGGWGEYHFQNHRILEKGGALEGYRAVLVLVPEKKWGAAILTNLNLTVLPESIRAELLERLLGRPTSDTQASILNSSKELEKMVIPPARSPDAKPPTFPLTAFTGTYVNDHYGEWEVVEKEGQLAFIAGPAKLEGTLTQWDGNDFIVTWPLVNAGRAEVDFREKRGQITGFLFDDEQIFERKK